MSDITFRIRPECPFCDQIPKPDETHGVPHEIENGVEYVCTMWAELAPTPSASFVIKNLAD